MAVLSRLMPDREMINTCFKTIRSAMRTLMCFKCRDGVPSGNRVGLKTLQRNIADDAVVAQANQHNPPPKAPRRPLLRPGGLPHNSPFALKPSDSAQEFLNNLGKEPQSPEFESGYKTLHLPELPGPESPCLGSPNNPIRSGYKTWQIEPGLEGYMIQKPQNLYNQVDLKVHASYSKPDHADGEEYCGLNKACVAQKTKRIPMKRPVAIIPPRPPSTAYDDAADHGSGFVALVSCQPYHDDSDDYSDLEIADSVHTYEEIAILKKLPAAYNEHLIISQLQ